MVYCRRERSHNTYILETVNIYSNGMLTMMRQEKPRFLRVQHNPSNKQWMVTIPLEIAEVLQLEKGDSMKVFLDENKRIILDLVT